MITNRTAFIILIASVLFFLVALLPVGVVISFLNADRFSYSKLSGSIFEMNFEDLTTAGYYVGNVTYKPELTSMLIGDLAGEIEFSNKEQHGRFAFKHTSHDTLSLTGVTALVLLNTNTALGPISGAMRFNSDSAVISMQTGCRSGVFSITTNAFDQIFERFAIEPFLIEGNAVCNQTGIISIEMSGNSNDMSLMIEGNVASNQNWNNPNFDLNTFIQPVPGKTFSPQMIQLLQASGLSVTEQGYSLALSLGSARN